MTLEDRIANQTGERANWLQGIPQREGAVVGDVLALDADGKPRWTAPSGGPGATDHGALTGLADDDHTQYHTDTRGDARYWPLTTDLATQVELDSGLAGKASTSHAHAGEDITSGTVADIRIAATIARDSEVTSAISTHEAAADPHTGYQRESEKGAVNGYASLDGSGVVPDAQIPSGIARDSEVTTAISNHEGAADPHTGYQKESEKAAASGYASLDTSTRVPDAQLGSGTPDATKFLRGDRTWAAPAGGGEAFPVGAVFIAVVSTSPATLLGYGTWSQIAAGRMLVGQTGGDVDFDTAEETGGVKTVALQTSELPAHTHAVTDLGHTHLTQRYPTATGGSSGFTIDTSMSGTLADNTLPTKIATTGITVDNAGSGAAHNNMPPYFVVYVWKRTA